MTKRFTDLSRTAEARFVSIELSYEKIACIMD